MKKSHIIGIFVIAIAIMIIMTTAGDASTYVSFGEAIERAEDIGLSLGDQKRFAQALLSPPQPTPALKRAFVRRSELMRAE